MSRPHEPPPCQDWRLANATALSQMTQARHKPREDWRGGAHTEHSLAKMACLNTCDYILVRRSPAQPIHKSDLLQQVAINIVCDVTFN